MKKKKETRVCVRCKKTFPIEQMYRLHGSLLCEKHYDESREKIAGIWKEFAEFCEEEGKKPLEVSDE